MYLRLYFYAKASLGTKQYKRERRRSPKIGKLRASGKVFWAKVTTLTFMLILVFKSKARKKQRKVFFRSIKKNENKIATFSVTSHGYF